MDLFGNQEIYLIFVEIKTNKKQSGGVIGVSRLSAEGITHTGSSPVLTTKKNK